MCSRFLLVCMLNFCFDKPIEIALGCFDSVLSNITCFLVCVLDYMLNFCFDKPIEIALGCFDSVLSNITCFLVCVLDYMLNFCFDKPIEIALGCFDTVFKQKRDRNYYRNSSFPPYKNIQNN